MRPRRAGMAELAAKIRARFKRRHSAIPGVPSLLLSRSSIRSSGSHGSSLFRTHSHGQSTTAGHDEEADVAGDVGLDAAAKSRTGSPRVSEMDVAAEGEGDGGGTKGDPVLGGAAPPEVSVVVGREKEAAQGERKEGEGEEGPGDGEQPQPQPQLELQPMSSHISDHPPISPDLDLPDTNAPSSSSPSPSSSSPGVDDAAAANHQDVHDDQSTTAAALTATSAPAPAPAPAPPTAGSSGPTPLEPPEPSEDPSTPSTPTSTEPRNKARGTCNMPGSAGDRHTALRKLSSIHEQPSPGQIDDKGPDSDLHTDMQPKQDQSQTRANPALDDSDSSAPSSTAVPPPPTDAAPVSDPTKRDDAKPVDSAVLPAPRISTSTATTPAATTRPLHIPLPPASFGPPSASNLSPGAIYSAASALAPTAPTSPLARYSQTLAAVTAGTPVAASGAASASAPRPAAPARRQSLLSNRQSTLIQTLLRGPQTGDPNGLNPDQLLPISGNMVMRKIWVKRPGGSATLVTINEDDVVDDVRDMILRKYANSLGRQFDSPDLTLRIRPGGNQQERMLGPEEPMARTLDAYFPSGQTIDDALIIDVPLRRTPRASPRSGPPHAPHIQYYAAEDPRPPETANDYFGPGALSAAAHLPVTVTAPPNGSAQHAHAISVLSTGQVPQIPSPGSRRARDYRERPERPRLGRQHTSSPTLINLISGTAHQGSNTVAAAAPHGTQAITHGNARMRPRTHSEVSDKSQAVPQPPPMPTPPPAEASAVPQRVATPPPRVSSPRPAGSVRPKKSKKNTEHPSFPKGMLNGSVPPINVLIVEDNIINLKLLEAFVKRLKVRWSTAMNGRDAVTKWRSGGFHLVLMDIQLPVMSGLDATREIRRLERVNSIGVFSSAASTAPEEVKGEPDEKDKLGDMELFKSPVIIVALTASSLQSDRHEALAAGCNDFLTKVCITFFPSFHPPPIFLKTLLLGFPFVRTCTCF